MAGDRMPDGDSACPACGRFIGPDDQCPYCETDSVRAPLMKTLRWTAVTFALAGLAVLLLTSRSRELPIIRAADLRPEMNFARVRMAGVVERAAFVGERNGAADYVAFSVNDGSGAVRVAAYAAAARQLVASRQIPRADDRVEIRGTLALGRDGTLKLRLDAADGLRIEPTTPRKPVDKVGEKKP